MTRRRQYGMPKTNCDFPRVRAFTLVELLSSIAIIAILTALAVVFIGNYVSYARQTSERQTLTVLNDALTRYKTEGGSLTALTAGASVGRVLRSLSAPVSWNGLTHQFMQAGATYPARSLSGSGDGRQYKFTRFGSYTDVGSEVSGKLSALGVSPGSTEEFNAWLTSAMATAGSSSTMVLKNPSSTLNFEVHVQVVSSGKKVVVWWGDGTTETFSPSSSSNSAITKTYSTAADRAIVMVGDIKLVSYNANNDTNWWGGDISGLKSLQWLYLIKPNASVGIGGDFKNLPRTLSYLYAQAYSGGNLYNFGGNVADLPRGLTEYTCESSVTVSGLVKDLPRNLITFHTSWGACTLSGPLTDMPANMNFVFVGGNSALSGNLANLPSNMGFLYAHGTGTTITGDIASLPASLAVLGVSGTNTISGNISSLKPNLNQILWVEGNNTITGDLCSVGNMGYLRIRGNSSITASSTTLPTGISYISTNHIPTVASVNNILAGFWAARDAAKPRGERVIELTGTSPAPTGQGLVDKAALQAYRSPNNNVANGLWTVITN